MLLKITISFLKCSKNIEKLNTILQPRGDLCIVGEKNIPEK